MRLILTYLLGIAAIVAVPLSLKAQPPVKSDAPLIPATVGPSQFQRGVKADPAKSDAPLLGTMTAQQKAEHAKKYPRGLKGPTPKAKLQSIPKFQATITAPTQAAFIPSAKRYWGNNQYGNCVPVASIASLAAWTTFCGQPVIATDAEAIKFSRDHGWLNGTWATEVMDVMQSEGVTIGGKVYKEGPYGTVDYKSNTALQSAVAVGPNMIAIDADALPSSAGNRDGWYVTGNTHSPNTDHEVVILGFGPAKWLYEQIHTPLPAALLPDQQGFLVFTWSTIGFVDFPWIQGTVVECFVRNPTTVGFAPPAPVLAPKVTLNVTPTAIQAGGQVTVTWRTENAVRVTMQGIDVIPNGSKVDTLNGPFTYEVIAYGGEGTTPAKATQAVTVTPGPGPGPGPGPTPGPGFTGSLNYVNGVLVSVTPGPAPVTAETVGAAFVEKIRFCPEVLVAALALYAAYQTHDPVQIAMAAAQLAAAWKACQSPPPQTMPGLAPAPRRLLAPAAQPIRRVAEGARNLFPLFPGLRSHLRGGAGTSYHESSRFRLHTWGTVQTVQTGPTAVAAITSLPPAPMPFPPVPAVPTAPVPPPAVVPAGHHAHVRADGTVFVHGDENHGNAAAHAGVTWPWPKAAVAGQPCPTGGCPTGTCPTEQQPARFRLFRR